MPKTQINCPNCRQPVVADIEQVFDVGNDPSAKQRLLSGSQNQIACPHCGYQGAATTMVVYHDPDKELLLTYSPPELGLPHTEQERRLGSLINQVVNNLPQERRKAYLLQPQSMFTYQSLIERVLEADGITREMIEEQQKRLNLLQRMVDITSDDTLQDVAKQEDDLIDMDFFNLLRNLAGAAEMSADQESYQKLIDLQSKLMTITTVGQELKVQAEEIEAALQDLRELGDQLTREKFLELILNAPTETRLSALVSLARPAIDYEFYLLLSERIDKARGEGRSRLVELREQLQEMTREYDQQVEVRVSQARQLIDKISNEDDIERAMVQELPTVDEFFINELTVAIESAQKEGDLEYLEKLHKMIAVLNQAMESPPEIKFIEELLTVPENENQEEVWRKMMDDNQDMITGDFLNSLANISAQSQSGEEEALAGRLQRLNRLALRYSMERNI
ncbi:MAG: CpXC domain-containing protein [Chloroflexota bacterium]|nr:CpXC domain-containing protein [Chloroflexota bacterium]